MNLKSQKKHHFNCHKNKFSGGSLVVTYLLARRIQANENAFTSAFNRCHWVPSRQRHSCGPGVAGRGVPPKLHRGVCCFVDRRARQIATSDVPAAIQQHADRRSAAATAAASTRCWLCIDGWPAGQLASFNVAVPIKLRTVHYSGVLDRSPRIAVVGGVLVNVRVVGAPACHPSGRWRRRFRRRIDWSAAAMLACTGDRQQLVRLRLHGTWNQIVGGVLQAAQYTCSFAPHFHGDGVRLLVASHHNDAFSSGVRGAG